VADSDDKALAVRAPAAPVPKLVLAKDLAAATPRSFVHIDRDGQVRSPARFRAIEAVSYAALGGTALAVTILYGMAFGVVGGLLGVLLALGFGVGIRRARRLQKAARLIINDRVEEAQRLLEDLRGGRGSRRFRALVEQNLAACHLRRGRFEEALAHQRASIALHGTRRRSPFARIAEYGELLTLVSLGRAKEARELLGRRHADVPTGDYLLVQHWVAELYIAFAEGTHAIDADELFSRARVALGITSAAALLGLLAWAHHAAGDTDTAWHLLREAQDREAGLPIAQTMPGLHAWMEEHRAAAEAAADDPFSSLR
jgi:hypothetical protein